MFSGDFIPGVKIKENTYFIDKNPEPFETILNSLRTDQKIIIPKTKEKKGK
jgi:hypothetical protein